MMIARGKVAAAAESDAAALAHIGRLEERVRKLLEMLGKALPLVEDAAQNAGDDLARAELSDHSIGLGPPRERPEEHEAMRWRELRNDIRVELERADREAAIPPN